MEILKEYYPYIAMILLGGGSLAIPLVRKVALDFAWKGITSLFTEKFVARVFLKIAETIVLSTKTTLDDEWFKVLSKKIKEDYKL